MSRTVIRSSQLLALVLVAAGLVGMYREPAATDPQLIALHTLHFKYWAGVAGVGCLLFDPERLTRGLTGIAAAWKAKQ